MKGVYQRLQTAPLSGDDAWCLRFAYVPSLVAFVRVITVPLDIHARFEYDGRFDAADAVDVEFVADDSAGQYASSFSCKVLESV